MVTLVRASLLLLAPIGFLAVTIAARSSAQTLGRARRAASLAVRCLIVLLLTCALGGPVWTRIADYPRCTIFLADVSESIPAGSLDKALAEVKPRWDREIAAGHRCALVAFAGRPQVLLAPSRRPLEVTTIPPNDALERNATDLHRALDLARTLFQERSANRIILLTDGLNSAAPAREIDLPPGTLALSLTDPQKSDLAIVDVQAPLAVRAGEPFDVRVTVSTDRAADFGLSLVLDDTALPEATKRHSVPGPGRHVVVLPHLQQKAAFGTGLHRLLVMADIPGDREPRNNVGLAAVTVTGKPKVLLVEGTPADGEFIARMLKMQDIDFVRRSPAELTPRSEALDEFVAVVLAGVGRETLASATVSALKTYVQQTGGGLWVVGAPSLQGTRGYAGSELEKLLPLSFTEASSPIATDPPKKDPPPAPPPPPPQTPDPEDAKPAKVLAPSIALLLLVDKSGSMAGRNIEIVKESCIATAKALSRRDVIGVLAFDHNPHVLLEFTEAERIDYITQRILRLLADGGTRIQPALEAALHLFQIDPRAQRCAIKHAVLLSDGDAPAADYETAAKRLADEGVTVSTVCVSGAKFDPVLMNQIATWGKGKFYFTNSFNNVPQLILNETQRIVAQLPKDDKNPPPPAPAPKNPVPPPAIPPPPPTPKTPDAPAPLQPVVLKDVHEILAGIDGKTLPGLRGRLGAVVKPRAEVPLATKEGQPVLALGRFGLGKTAVWASDLSSPWSSDWLSWKDSPKLFAQLIRFISGAGPDSELGSRVRLTPDGARALLHLDAAGPGGEIKVTDAAGTSLPLRRTSDGEGIVEIDLARPGELRRLLLQRADGKTMAVGAIRAYDEEFAPRDTARDLFANGVEPMSWDQIDHELGGGRSAGDTPLDLAPWLIVAALLLLPVDVALRRLMTS
jgi:Ca-activated chloride channel family protein